MILCKLLMIARYKKTYCYEFVFIEYIAGCMSYNLLYKSFSTVCYTKIHLSFSSYWEHWLSVTLMVAFTLKFSTNLTSCIIPKTTKQIADSSE